MGKLSLFIIGMPRSGTKLLRDLLNNHKEVFIPRIETLFIPELLETYGSAKLTKEEVLDVIDELKNSLFFFYYLKENQFDFKKLEVESVTIKEFFDLFFMELAYQNESDALILGDKSPNYIKDIKLLIERYPEAKFIHIVRDPRDYALSVNKAWNKNIYRAAFRWANAMYAIEDLDQNQRKRLLEITYEDLISNPEETLKNICAFLSIEFNKQLLNLDHSVENLGDARAAKIDATNRKKYLSELENEEILRIEDLTIEYIKKYNYGFNTQRDKNKEVSILEKLYWKIADVLALIRFNFDQHGIKNGIEKLIKANKYS